MDRPRHPGYERAYTIEYGASAQKDLDDLPAAVRAQVLRKIEKLRDRLAGNVKRLHESEAAFRLRMGDYRILFDVEGDVIVIRKIGNRKDIYD
jgi:mRNA interferase RelE/StbE